MHIPPQELMDIYNNGYFYGSINEAVSCPLLNTRLIDLMNYNLDVTGVFVGHDHINTFGGWYQNIELAFSIKTGYGGYGPLPGTNRGGRVIVLQEIIDNKTNEIIGVNRNHYLVYEDGTENHNKELKTRGDNPFQSICAVPDIDPMRIIIIQTVICILIFKAWLIFFEDCIGFLRKLRMRIHKKIDNKLNKQHEEDINWIMKDSDTAIETDKDD